MEKQAIISKRFSPGQVIFREGEKANDEMYIIIRGTVRILKSRDEKEKIMLAEFTEGAIIGEMALISKEPRSASAVAVNEVEVRVISQESFEQSAAGIPPWAMCIARVLVLRLRNINLSIEDRSRSGSQVSEQSADKKDNTSGSKPASKKAIKQDGQETPSFSIGMEAEKSGILYLHGYLFKDNLTELGNAINRLARAKIPKIFLDFSHILDIDKDALAFLTGEVRRLAKFSINLHIQNIQLIHSKIQTSSVLAKVCQLLEPSLQGVVPGQCLMKQGEDGNALYIVKTGRFKVTRTVDGKEVVFGEVGTGDVIGEMALIAGGKRSATVTAVSPGRVYRISEKEFNSNHFHIPQWFLSILRQLVARIRNAGIKFDQIVQQGESKKDGSSEIRIDYMPDRKKSGIFKLKGIFTDENNRKFENNIIRLIRTGFDNLVFDLSEVESMTDEYMFTFRKAENSLRKRGGALHLIRATPTVNTMLQQNKLIRGSRPNLDFYTNAEAITELSRDIDYDTITGLYHTGYFEQYLEEELERCHRYKGVLSLLAVAVDRFTEVSGGLDKREKEFVLREFGAIITDRFRKADVAARFGEYEFIISLPGTDLQNAGILAGRFQDEIEQHSFTTDSGSLTVTCSLGVVGSLQKETAVGFQQRARSALAEACEEGYNQLKVKLAN